MQPLTPRASRRSAGIKKQACINRKCLVMVPRDEDGEKLARKRAKQRAVVPIVAPLGAIPSALGGDPTAFLSGLPSGLNIQVPSMAPMIMVPSSPSVDSSCALGSPRSGLSSPATPEGTPSRAIVDASSVSLFGALRSPSLMHAPPFGALR